MTGYKTIATDQLLALREGSQKLRVTAQRELALLSSALQDPPADTEARELMIRTREGLMDLDKQIRSNCRDVDTLVQKPPIRNPRILSVVGGRDAETEFAVDPETGQLVDPS